MRKGLSNSTFNLNKRLPKRHCKSDLACSHCCQCWLTRKSQYEQRIKILQKRSKTDRQQIDLQKSLNKDLMQQVNSLKETLKLYSNVDNIKDKLKQQIREEFEVDLVMKQHQIQELSENNSRMSQELMQLYEETITKDKEINQLRAQNIQLQDKNGNLATQLQITEKQLQILRTRNYQLESAVEQKQNVIDQLQDSCREIDLRFNEQKAKASNFEGQIKVLRAHSRVDKQEINRLTKDSEENYRNIARAEIENSDLQYMVSRMNNQIVESKAAESYLKDRLIRTEGMANYNSEKMKMMKADVQRLKYVL